MYSQLTDSQLIALKLRNLEVLPNGAGVPSIFELPKKQLVLRFRVAYYSVKYQTWVVNNPAFSYLDEILNAPK